MTYMTTPTYCDSISGRDARQLQRHESVRRKRPHRSDGALVQDAGLGVEAVRVAAASHHPARHWPQDAFQPRQ